MAVGLTVGDFARITHLSVKPLGHYHEVGLLEPATVTPGTGYRYYSAAQVPTAQVIRRLRDLEMPVSQVKTVLGAPDARARNALIAAHLGRLEAELAQTRAAVESLRNLLQPPDGEPAIEHRSVPAIRAAGITAVVGQPDLLPWWQGALGELHATVRAQGQRAAELAVISHCGSLADADLSYATLGSYATRHEISIDGPLREYYLRGAADTPDEAEWRTEIGWPIFRADAIGGARPGRGPPPPPGPAGGRGGVAPPGARGA